MSDEERSDSLQSVEIPNDMYQQAYLSTNGTGPQMVGGLPSDLHQLEVMTGMSHQTLNDLSAPHLRILEQPKQRGFRFRYDCEGPSHGGLPGQNNQKGKRTYPSVEIVNHVGVARIVVSLVTNEEVPRPHAHSLVGKHCNDGQCMVQVGPADMTASFPNLGILHVTRKNVEKVLKDRLRQQQKLYCSVLGDKGYQSSTTHGILDSEEDLTKKAKEMSKEMDLSVVRLCFQAYLPDATGHFNQPLQPVVSVPIYDSKAPGATTLKICRMDKSSGCVTGNEEVYLLCDKVQKEDVAVRFFEINSSGEVVWEAHGEFGPTDVHRQFAIVFKTPRYKDCYIQKPVYVQVQLQRRSDREVSDPKPFTYHPQLTDKESILRKRKKQLPSFQDHCYPGGGGKGGYGGTRGGGAPNAPLNMNFGGGGGGPANAFQAPTTSQGGNVQRDQQHLSIMSQFRQQQQLQLQQRQQQQQGQQGLVMQSHGVGKDSKRVVVLPTAGHSTEAVQDSQPATVPMVDAAALNDEEVDSDLEVDSAPVEEPEVISRTKMLDVTDLIVERAKSQTDHGVQTDDLPFDYDSLAWRLAERTSRALHDFAKTADIKMVLAVQRHLTAVEDENGDTPLHLAIIHKKQDVILGLLNVIVSIPNQKIVNHVNKLRQTPLHVAVATQQRDVVEVLLRCGADPNILDHNGNMPLHLAAEHGLKDITLLLIQGPPPPPGQNRSTIEPIKADLNAKNLDGMTAAHISVSSGHLMNLKVLVKNGADVNIPDGKSGRTPLHYAVEQENFSFLSFLIGDADADIHARTYAGDTPLHLACSLDFVAVAAVLVSAGADPSVENYDTSDEYMGEVGVASGDGHLEEFEEEYGVGRFEGHGQGRELKGKTPVDMAQSPRMASILKGESYIPSLSQSVTSSYTWGLPQKGPTDSARSTADSCYHSRQGSAYRPSTGLPTGDMNRLDSLVRRKLESLLDEVKPHKDWISLADRLGLGNMINQLKQFDSPTSILLDQYEAMDGTIDELTSVLKSLNREDVLNVIEELKMPAKRVSNLAIKEVDHGTQVDSGLASSLHSMHLASSTASSGPAKGHLKSSQLSAFKNVRAMEGQV
ncbi:nuclear factor NF-kappa-B p105 subunit-like [Acanthaster planci]|uniref:Nuclear factor NF-kappa-B p105 subunit-like n=1 Tax=Acanthaster planci TaxID=133434 RepID=A0A8B7Y2U2_ACAPL|nr:nuclear factor NF-kappa-B p105 subunit-like [Acanthaster planci]